MNWEKKKKSQMVMSESIINTQGWFKLKQVWWAHINWEVYIGCRQSNKYAIKTYSN